MPVIGAQRKCSAYKKVSLHSRVQVSARARSLWLESGATNVEVANQQHNLDNAELSCLMLRCVGGLKALDFPGRGRRIWLSE
jgi:hypothetical protein